MATPLNNSMMAIWWTFCSLHRKPPKFKSVVLVLLLMSNMMWASAQRTYMRHCDCEYMVDGKCAYTILLPINGGESVECPVEGGEGKVNENVTAEIAALRNNVSWLTENVLNNTQQISQYQGTILYLLQQVPQIEIPDGQGQQPSTDNSQDIQEIKATIESQSTSIAALNSSLARMAQRVQYTEKDLDTVKQEVARFSNILSTLLKNITDVNVTDIAVNVVDIKMATLQEEIRRLKSQVCEQRGLMVSSTPVEADDQVYQAGFKVNVTESSTFDPSHGADKARIDNNIAPGAWCPAEPNKEEWLQYDLGLIPRMVYGVVTRGRADYSQWVTSYILQYRLVEEQPWQTFTNVIGEREVLEGNTDQQTAKINMLWEPITTRYLRIVPLTAHLNSNKCMRADLIGCLDGLGTS